MSDSSQRRATGRYRRRLAERGMARFEVLGRDMDRALIRFVARPLSEKGPDADRLHRGHRQRKGIRRGRDVQSGARGRDVGPCAAHDLVISKTLRLCNIEDVPTVYRFDGLRVVIYPSDHPPAHVHVIGAGREAIFSLQCPHGPPELRDSFGFALREANRIRATLSRVLPVLCDEWRRIHGHY